MRIFGFGKSRQKQVLSSVPDRGWYTIFESFTGAWQQNVEVDRDAVLAFSTVYACISLISQDIGKLGLKLVELGQEGIWNDVERASPFWPVLRKPNRFQTRIQFIQHWISSKLIHGNTYVLKVRDNRSVVRQLYVLDPQNVTPLVAPDGSVFYRLRKEEISGLEEPEITVPASEIIHDKMVTLFHPLVGVSPIFACGLAATQGLTIQDNSAKFFQNGSRPSGILTAPGAISDETASRLKTAWETNYGGENSGKVAVVGDGLTYSPMTIPAQDAQLIEQLKWTAETVASTFHVPAYKVGVGPLPTYQNAAILNQIYYSDCLQALIESLELCLDDGLELNSSSETRVGVEFDLDDLMRMDQALLWDANSKAVGGGWMKPNEARKRANLPPVDGGDTPYLQVQNYSLQALNKRDQQDDPFNPGTPSPEPTAEPEEMSAEWQTKALAAIGMELAA